VVARHGQQPAPEVEQRDHGVTPSSDLERLEDTDISLPTNVGKQRPGAASSHGKWYGDGTWGCLGCVMAHPRARPDLVGLTLTF
ncbi:hypothetical protein, partial [Salmonella enterica]|uniref:hypothetical protein n=1 Tax=Salmonella enterica TaxID=28901 RepID=UPI003FA6E83F